ncbi:MAG: efflux RND transporter periplasmic adaptor subunit [Deltaproteobacteria bacterium]|nr:efflux RND transporter periplasmic adaptor subunit [Deltaproteobacteria bacterium]
MKNASHKKTIIAMISLAVLACVGLLARHFLFSTNTPAYITASVNRMDIEEKVVASGTLNAFKTVEVGAQVSGQLKALHVVLGDKVKKGQLLAEIDPVLQQNALKDAEAQVENLQAQRHSKQALLKQYESAFQRQSQMFAEEASARADMESAQAQLESTRADISSLDAQIKKADIAVDTARANLGYTKIAAPMDGVVISIVTEEGQTVVSTQAATTILKLANVDTITVKAQISEADVMRVKPGQTVYFTTLGDAETRHYGKLHAVEPGPVSTSTSTSTSGTSTSSTSSSSGAAIYYNGLFDVPNPGNTLKVSMTAQVSIVLSEAKQALSIPVSSLGNKEKDGRYTVKVLRDNTPEIRNIRVGNTDNIHVQVIDGLLEGDRVIVGDNLSTAASTDAEKTGQLGPPPPRRG